MNYSYRYRYMGKDGKVKYAKSLVQAPNADDAKVKIKRKHPTAYKFLQLGQW